MSQCVHIRVFLLLYFFLSFHSSSEFVFIQQNVYNGDNVLFFLFIRVLPACDSHASIVSAQYFE